MSHLLHPELFDLMPITGERLRPWLDSQAVNAAELNANIPNTAAVSVVVRTVNEAGPLRSLCKDISAQVFPGTVEIVVVDNQSTDQTEAVARSLGATVRTIPRSDFTHPRSLNMGMQAASHDAVFLTSGHVALSNDQLIATGYRHLQEDASGVYSWPPLANKQSSRTERIGTALASRRLRTTPEHISKTRWGVLCLAGAMISRPDWEALGGFDEAYETGGEDAAFADKLLSQGHRISFEPVMAIHHTHGLTLGKRVKRSVKLKRAILHGGEQFDRANMARSRPDLNLND